jgi:hypothetical protein
MVGLKALLHHADFRLARVFLYTYLALALLAVLHFVSAGGDMAGLVFVLLALPWPLLGDFLFQHAGFVVGYRVGLLLNPVCVFLLGYWVSLVRRRSARPPESPT